jgi:hypothetical protein
MPAFRVEEKKGITMKKHKFGYIIKSGIIWSAGITTQNTESR